MGSRSINNSYYHYLLTYSLTFYYSFYCSRSIYLIFCYLIIFFHSFCRYYDYSFYCRFFDSKYYNFFLGYFGVNFCGAQLLCCLQMIDSYTNYFLFWGCSWYNLNRKYLKIIDYFWKVKYFIRFIDSYLSN